MNTDKTSLSDNVDLKAIDNYINSIMKSFKIPGLVLAIVKGEQIFYLKGYGKSDVSGKPVTPQTPFIIASLSKSFTGLAISQLIEAGKIDINAPVQTYLPWFTLADTEAVRQITIKNLLSQTSGLSTGFGIEVLYTNTSSIKKHVKYLARMRISQPVGSKFHYCNLNYYILEEVIEAVTGIPYGQYIEINILRPLDMQHSYTSQAKAKRDGLATGFTAIFGFMIPFTQPGHRAFARLIVSAEDMAHYLIAQLNNGIYGGNSIISSHGMEQTQTNLIPGLGNYGMGWFIGNGSIFHLGTIANFRANIYMRNGNNGEKWGVAVLMNSSDILRFVFTGIASYGDISFDIIQILHGQQPNNNYSPVTITSFLRNVLRLKKFQRNPSG